jgi:hypothetical protein
VVSLWASGAIAQEPHADSCERDEVTKVYYTNGVGTSRVEARIAMRSIQAAYRDQLEAQYPTQKFEFRVAYNQSGSTIDDVREVSLQRDSERLSVTLTLAEIFAVSRLSTPTLILLRHLAERQDNEHLRLIVEAALNPQSDLKEVAASLSELSQDQLSESNEIIYQEYRRGLMAGDRVIVFAHSQGNLFANHAVERLHQEKPEWAQSISIINVANPDNRVLSGSFCVTADDDIVIQNLLGSFEEVADCGIDNDVSISPFERDISNHGFLDAYFAEGLPSRARIDGFFESLIAGLTFPEAELSDGALRVTLEWTGDQDIDLHITEPNGETVYYGSRVGPSGELDRDDTDGHGPENYFVACDALEEGTYQFKVHYYSGSGAADITLLLSTFTNSTSRAATTLSSADDEQLIFEVTARRVEGVM